MNVVSVISLPSETHTLPSMLKNSENTDYFNRKNKDQL